MTIAEIVTANPPRCIAEFRQGSVRVHQIAHMTEIQFDLHCPQCGHDGFGLYEEAVPDLWPRAVGVTCKTCFSRIGLFETYRHGYDGELGHIGPPSDTFHVQAMAGEDGTPVEVSPLRVGFAFNIDLAELQEIATGEGKAVQDLFDWFNIYDGDETVWDWECA